MVVSFSKTIDFNFNHDSSSEIRFAKNAYGQMGVIPQNYVQAVADPPEPAEPPPSSSTFSGSGYPNLDTFNGNNTNNARLSSSSFGHTYMNPSDMGNWQPQEQPAWAPPPPVQQPPPVYNVRFL